MAFNTRQSTMMYFSALVISLVYIQSVSSENINSPPSERVKRRSYYNPWSTVANRRNAVSLYDASRVYRPPTYTIPRPYYIPVYGTQGRPMLFYPPQPLYVNPGVPQDNPIYPPYRGPTYLPPKESPHLPDESKTMPPKEAPITTPKAPITTAKAPITTAQGPVAMTTPMTVNRLGEDTDEDNMQDFDDPNAPVWGGGSGAANGAMAGMSNGGAAGTSNGGAGGTSNGGMTGMALSGGGNKESGPVPTRAPMTRPTTPPLVHNPEASAEFVAQPSQASRPAQRPRPPSTQSALRTTTVSPVLGPSNCVWAIISCCSAGNPRVLPQNCFEQRGCPGPFWGTSPCESEFARAAIAAAVNYYNSPRNNLGK